MRKTVNIDGKIVGESQAHYVVAGIGINHNGSLETAKQLIFIYLVYCSINAYIRVAV